MAAETSLFEASSGDSSFLVRGCERTKSPNSKSPYGIQTTLCVSAKRTRRVQNTGLGQNWRTSTPPSQLPIGYYEQYMTPHARFPSSSAVVATEMFSFRLKGGSSSKSRPSSSAAAGGGIRSGEKYRKGTFSAIIPLRCPVGLRETSFVDFLDM